MHWAILAHHRWWCSFDFVEQCGALAAKGPLPASTIRRVARAYGISGIRKSDDVAYEYGRLVFNLAERWPASLGERAEECIVLAKTAQGHLTRGLQLSSASKFIWFLHPRDWTMYDSSARIGLGIGGSPNETTFRAFYQELSDRKFAAEVDRLRKILSGVNLAYLQPERIVDTLLMARGQTPVRREADRTMLSHYLTMPSFDGTALDRAAEAASESIGSSFLQMKLNT
jgi:hypothetical protein